MADGVRSVHSKALPNHQRAVIPENKLLRYSLDPTHPRGSHKAIVFKSALGFDQSNWHLLKRIILDEVPYHEAIQVSRTYSERGLEHCSGLKGRTETPQTLSSLG